MSIDCNISVFRDTAIKDTFKIEGKRFGDRVTWLILNATDGPIDVELVDWTLGGLHARKPIVETSGDWEQLPPQQYSMCEATITAGPSGPVPRIDNYSYKTKVTFSDKTGKVFSDPELEIIFDFSGDHERLISSGLSEILKALSSIDNVPKLFPFGIQVIKVKAAGVEIEVSGTIPPPKTE